MYGTSVETVGIGVFMKNGAYILCAKPNLSIIYVYFFFTHIHTVTAYSS